jgi:HAD superfamily hydrolase (TIGR01490 family)
VRHRLADPDEYRRRNQAFYDDYRAGRLDQMAFLRFSLEPLTRYSMDELDAWHRLFMRETIEPMMLGASRALVADRIRSGDLVAIVTSTNRFITSPIARAYGIENLIATEPEIRDGRYTGAVVGTPAFREGKVARLGEWLAARGSRLADFEESSFFSDSINDLPLLEHVSQPVAVDPDRELAAIAQRRGWPVISLRKPRPETDNRRYVNRAQARHVIGLRHGFVSFPTRIEQHEQAFCNAAGRNYRRDRPDRFRADRPRRPPLRLKRPRLRRRLRR